MQNNAPSNGKTLVHLLADWRNVYIPPELPKNKTDIAQWLEAARDIGKNCELTIHFADWHIGKLQLQDRYYFTLFEARAESITGRKICQKMGKSKSLKGLRSQAERLRDQYDSLGCLFIALFELREPLLEARAGAAL